MTRTMLISEREAFLAQSLEAVIERLLKLDPGAEKSEEIIEARRLLSLQEPLVHCD